MNARIAEFGPRVTGDDPDIVLMLRVQCDEPGAFAELIERFGARLFGRFFRQFGDRQEAEDLAQDVFLRLFRNRKRLYRPSAKFATWLFHIARNVARNAIRNRRRRPLAPSRSFDIIDDIACCRRLPMRVDVPSRTLERAEVSRVVRRAVAGLKSRQRRAVELQCLDHSYSEIADQLDMTAKAAKSLLYRARNELRQSLTPLHEALC